MKKSIMLTVIVALSLCFKSNAQNIERQNPIISEATMEQIISELQKNASPDQHERIANGVKQAASFWQAADGTESDFTNLCKTYSVKNSEEQFAVFNRMENNLELLFGSFNKMSVGLKIPLHVDQGDILEIDRIYGGYSPGAHLSDDFFANKLAFITILNFPFYSLQEKTISGKDWTRLEWAYARMGDIFKSRVPAEFLQNYSQVSTDADSYISDYNIYVGKLLDKKQKTHFPADMKLISHWGLRDEIKANYASKSGFSKQAIIYEVMLRIIRQEIPQMVINNPDYDWNPYDNIVFQNGQKVTFITEPDTRYQQVINLFKATQNIDAYSPHFPDYIKRKFDDDMEIPVDDVEKIFTSLVSSPELKDIGKIIEKRLGRKLQPWDIWYDGFKTRSTLDISKIDKMLQEKYPNKNAFEKDLPNILIKLGFNADSAKNIASRIIVDPSRGAGHAWGAAMKSDKARLRTRIGANGMDYKGYNIAIHEFGHNVEQTITLQNVDYYMLNGVPNTSFTEALAFVFQARDLELLGMEQENEMTKHLNALDNLWSSYEIMGVSLLDISVWKWLYTHPEATASELKLAVNKIATEIWNKYYAPVFGVTDSPILAVYSHMIDNPLYLSAYPIGQLIEFQFGSYIKEKEFADEIYRAFKQGRIVPQLWMKGAVGSEISAKPTIEAAAEAIKAIK
ncbi:MAG: hypothetical protein CVT92_15380 [Bacteroidetes bacterium HGW-Bacteroidetes-1]|jgi:hypothetical protein|nr:MAG: hypothetical protein CVT92_15380 [Bacteroidetes bacterium HGW-Bacteroidetes-1]